MKREQKYLNKSGMLLFLALISAFPPLSTDFYLPAMPQMAEALDASHSQVNMTLSMFFVVYASGLLFWGPLSEKFGRKPILMSGLGGYVIASALCAFSMTVEQLIVSRMLQAFCGSAITAVATAIVKDLYDGREREKVMATVMSMVIIAPMIAPVLGAFLLKITSWRMVFLILAGFGGITFAVTLLFQETLNEKFSGSVFRSWGRLWVVLKNPRFSSLLVIFSLVAVAMTAYLASSSYIYISEFGLSEQEFSLFFAFNAAAAMIGPGLYIRLSKYISTFSIVSGCFGVLLCCGIVVTIFGNISPLLFAITLALATLSVVTMRVPSVNLMLDQQNYDTGSATALIDFFCMIMGSLGMVLVMLNSQYLIESLGILQFLVGLVGGGLWLLVQRITAPFVVSCGAE